jgi:hypothetical protein
LAKVEVVTARSVPVASIEARRLMVERLMLHRHAEGPRGDEHGPTGEHDHEEGHGDGHREPGVHEKHGGLERVKLTPEGRVNAALRKIKADGTYQRLAARYFDFDISGN